MGNDNKYHDVPRNSGNKAEILSSDTHIYMYRLENTPPQTHSKHRHDFFSIDFIYEGEFVQIINEKECFCPAGSICLLSPFDTHQYINEKKASMISLVFNDDVILNQVWNALNIDSAPYFLTLDDEDIKIATERFNILEREYNNKSLLSSSVIRATATMIVIDIIRKSSPTLFPRPQMHDSVHKAVGYVRYHFREPLTLEETAKMYHVTPTHFCKYFKRHTGSTFKEYLISLRLDYAMRLIKTTDKSITEICIESGFSSPSYFTKAFMKRFGEIPSQIRN